MWSAHLSLLFLFQRHLKKALTDLTSRDYTEWVLCHPGQAVLTVVRLHHVIVFSDLVDLWVIEIKSV